MFSLADADRFGTISHLPHPVRREVMP